MIYEHYVRLPVMSLRWFAVDFFARAFIHSLLLSWC